MTEEEKPSEVISAAVALSVTAVATVVLHICAMLAYFSMAKGVSFDPPFLFRVVWFLPFATMMIPGVHRLCTRRWLSGSLLLVGGWILALPAMWIALGVAWTILM